MRGASVPNAVTDASYAELGGIRRRRRWFEILGVVCMFGVFNRWNDSMATPLEMEPMVRAGELLTDHGWSAGKHGDTPSRIRNE